MKFGQGNYYLARPAEQTAGEINKHNLNSKVQKTWISPH